MDAMDSFISHLRALPVGTIIPKPAAKGDFRVKGWGKRRGEAALIYLIPNHRDPTTPHQKGVTVSELQRARKQLERTGEFTRLWFKENLPDCSKEGDCNFTTIGGLFCLLGLASYESRGVYSTVSFS